MIDRTDFAECIVPRAKTGTLQAVAIPDILAPFLHVLWVRAGKPDAGPVFPARVDKRAGLARLPSNSFAKRLRGELFHAGMVRTTPIEVPATAAGTRTELGKNRSARGLAARRPPAAAATA